MSRRPGIGHGWYERFASDVYPSDEVIIKGRSMRPPRYYDKLYEAEFPLDFEYLKRIRVKKAKLYLDKHGSDSRLYVRE